MKIGERVIGTAILIGGSIEFIGYITEIREGYLIIEVSLSTPKVHYIYSPTSTVDHTIEYNKLGHIPGINKRVILGINSEYKPLSSDLYLSVRKRDVLHFDISDIININNI